MAQNMFSAEVEIGALRVKYIMFFLNGRSEFGPIKVVPIWKENHWSFQWFAIDRSFQWFALDSVSAMRRQWLKMACWL